MSTEIDKPAASPDTLQGSINLLKSHVQSALDNAQRYAQQQTLAQQQISRLKSDNDQQIAAIKKDKEETVSRLENQLKTALEEREQMEARLERIVSRLRLMGLEQSHYE